MRMQIHIRDDLAKVLNDVAWRENRWPKQQAEWILQQELERLAQDQGVTLEHPHTLEECVAVAEEV
jgi:hypothetical protein